MVLPGLLLAAFLQLIHEQLSTSSQHFISFLLSCLNYNGDLLILLGGSMDIFAKVVDGRSDLSPGSFQPCLNLLVFVGGNTGSYENRCSNDESYHKCKPKFDAY